MCKGGRRPSAGDDGGDEAPGFDRLVPITVHRVLSDTFICGSIHICDTETENSEYYKYITEPRTPPPPPTTRCEPNNRSTIQLARTQCCEPSPTTSAPSTFTITRRGVPTVKAWTQAFAPATRFGLAARGPLTRPSVFDIGTRLEPA